MNFMKFWNLEKFRKYSENFLFMSLIYGGMSYVGFLHQVIPSYHNDDE